MRYCSIDESPSTKRRIIDLTNSDESSDEIDYQPVNWDRDCDCDRDNYSDSGGIVLLIT